MKNLILKTVLLTSSIVAINANAESNLHPSIICQNTSKPASITIEFTKELPSAFKFDKVFEADVTLQQAPGHQDTSVKAEVMKSLLSTRTIVGYEYTVVFDNKSQIV